MTATPIDIVAWFVYVLASVMFEIGRASCRERV